MLLLSLRLVQDLLGADLPDAVLRRIARDPAARALATALAERLFRATPGEAGVFENVRFHLAMRERLADRARYCVLRALTPNEHDRTPHARSTPLALLDYVRRPARLVREYGRGGWGRRR